MPAVPRQGRKGGKVSSSPAMAANRSSPSATSPATLPPSTAEVAPPQEIPSEPNDELQFNLEALVNDGKRTSANSKKADEPSAGKTTTPSAVAGIDENVFRFNLAAIKQVGQGVVIGGAKMVRTDTHAPEASLEDVKSKVKATLAKQHGCDEADVMSILPKAKEWVATHEPGADAMLATRPEDTLMLAATIASCTASSKVLVVVPRYFEVSAVAEVLRHMIKKAPEVPHGGVGELTGQSVVGDEDTNFWVTNAQTALIYLHAQKSMAPFTHVAVPGLTTMTPLIAYFLWGLRERVYRRSANHDPSAIPLKVVLYAPEDKRAAMEQFFFPLKVASMAGPSNVTEFSYDEANALAGLDVLNMEVDRTGKFPGPHPKLVEHAVKLATGVVKQLLEAAEKQQHIFIFSSADRDTVQALQALHLEKVVIFCGRFPVDNDQHVDDASYHRIYVMRQPIHMVEIGAGTADFVLDMGTCYRLSQQNKSESYMAVNATEWASVSAVNERKHMTMLLRENEPCGYFKLYPPTVETVFPSVEPYQPAMADVEDAFLQCARAEMPVALATDLLVPLDAETMEQAAQNLIERCMLAPNLRITFVGEIAARLPLEIDLAHMLINGCALGFAEAAVIIASVCTLPFRNSMGDAASSLALCKEHTLESRLKYAEYIASQSDLLADVLVYLQWCRLKAQGESTQPLIAELLTKELRFEQIETLANYLRMQLSDYVFIDDLSNVKTVDRVAQCIKTNTTIFTFTEAVALARRVAFVRDEGNLNSRDRSAAMVFVRTSKKVVPNPNAASLVPWNLGLALVSANLKNFAKSIVASVVSTVSTQYLFAAFLLAGPQVEYSAPVELAGKGRVVYFGVTCNRQMKRFRVGIEEAAAILEFREKWNRALGCLQALRTMTRRSAAVRLVLELKKHNSSFDLVRFQSELQREFINLVTESDVAEHQGSFTTLAVHCLAPKEMLPPAPEAEASDILMTKKFHDNEYWRPVAQAASPSPTTADSKGGQADPALFPAAFIEDDADDEVEVIEESYFIKHGPIIDDDEDDN